MNFVPMVVSKSEDGEKCFDIYSKLLENRIIILSGEIDAALANTVIAELLYLDSLNHDTIYLYINSPGGDVDAGLAIYDTMRFIKSDVSTIAMGLAASMGAFLLACGTKGKRKVLRNADIMIHQVLGGCSGQASDIKIQSEHILDLKKRLNSILSKSTGKALRVIEKDTDRDHYLNSKEALDYGLVDDSI